MTVQSSDMYQIRLLTTDDAAAFSEVRLRALRAHPEGFGEDADEFAALPLAEIATRFGDGTNAFVLGAFAPALCGTTGFFRQKGAKDRHKGVIWGVYVDPSLRGKGVGRALMQEAIERARTIDGVEELHLTVTAINTGAIELYKTFGFTTYGVEPHALKVGDKYYAEEMMRLPFHR
jgi:ribosomal protein S18 acetylase RimI-like enzyme